MQAIDYCERCGGPIVYEVDLDAGPGLPAHCGRCSVLMDGSKEQLLDRIWQLEHEKVQLLDAATKVALQPSLLQLPTYHTKLAEKVAPILQRLVYEAGDWSTLRANQKEAHEACERCRELEARYAWLLSVVECMATDREDLVKAVRSAHRMGGRDAVEKLIHAEREREAAK